jgi:hypothetical protein
MPTSLHAALKALTFAARRVVLALQPVLPIVKRTERYGLTR